MTNKLILTEDASEKIDQLSRQLSLRRNIICRLATGMSLRMEESIEDWEAENGSGFEFNRYTLTGEMDKIFKALVIQRERKKLDDDSFFSEYLRKHIERGTEEMFKKFQKSSSEIDFLESFTK